MLKNCPNMRQPRLWQRHILVFTFREQRVFVWADICAGCYKQPRYIFTGRKSSKPALFCRARWLVAGRWGRRAVTMRGARSDRLLHSHSNAARAHHVQLEKGPSEGLQTRRRPILGPSPGWKHLLSFTFRTLLRHYAKAKWTWTPG